MAKTYSRRSRWKLLTFALIAGLSICLGSHWLAGTDPNGVQAAPSPMRFAVYETDPDVPVFVDGRLHPARQLAQESDDFDLTVGVDSATPTSLVLVSNQAVQVSPGNTESTLPSVREATSGRAANDLYYLMFSPTAAAMSVTATFRAPSAVKLNSDTGNITASLPNASRNMISNMPGSSPFMDAGLLSGYHLQGDTVYEDFSHSGPGSSDISEFSVAPPDGELKGPKTFKVTERLIGGAEGLDHSDIKVDLPASGGPQESDFVWQTDSGVSPTLIAVSREAEQSYAAYIFGSGIAFAVAAAALIALIQEGPTRLRDLWSGANRTASASADGPARARPAMDTGTSQPATDEDSPAWPTTRASSTTLASESHSVDEPN